MDGTDAPVRLGFGVQCLIPNRIKRHIAKQIVTVLQPESGQFGVELRAAASLHHLVRGVGPAHLVVDLGHVHQVDEASSRRQSFAAGQRREDLSVPASIGMAQRCGDSRTRTQPLRKPSGGLGGVGQGFREVSSGGRQRRHRGGPIRGAPLRHELGHGDAHQLRTICVVGFGHPSAHVHVIARPKPALRRDGAGASNVVQQREVKDVREVRLGPARESSQLNRKQRISKRALRRHIVREVSGERNRGEQLGQTKAPIGLALFRYH